MSDWNGAPNPSLDARIEGTPLFSAPAGTKTEFRITFDFDCDLQGIELFAWSSNPGDNVELRTEYDINNSPGNPPIWRRYKKFGKNFNVYPNHVNRVIIFPTKPKVGVCLVVSYDNKGEEPVQFSLNKFQFIPLAKVDTSLGEEGEDW